MPKKKASAKGGAAKTKGTTRKASRRKPSPKHAGDYVREAEHDIAAVMEQIRLKKLELDELLGILGKLI